MIKYLKKFQNLLLQSKVLSKDRLYKTPVNIHESFFRSSRTEMFFKTDTGRLLSPYGLKLYLKETSVNIAKFLLKRILTFSFLLYELINLLPPDRVALQSRTYEKQQLEKLSQISKVATLLDFIFYFDGVFRKSRQRISRNDITCCTFP